MAGPARRVILVGVGCFNPPTIMHLRMFDVGRDYLEALTLRPHKVLGGIISPAHDKYGKASLIPSFHRSEMVSRATKLTRGFVLQSKWELEQDEWTPTKRMLDSYRTMITEYADGAREKPDWIPENASKEDLKDVRLLLLCGDDLVQSFSVPNLWKKDDIVSIVRDYGLIVLSRGESNHQKMINQSDILYEHRENIHFVLSDMGTDVSSTKIRLAVRRGQSIQYLVPDEVIKYIEEKGLYKPSEDEANEYTHPSPIEPNADTTRPIFDYAACSETSPRPTDSYIPNTSKHNNIINNKDTLNLETANNGNDLEAPTSSPRCDSSLNLLNNEHDNPDEITPTSNLVGVTNTTIISHSGANLPFMESDSEQNDGVTNLSSPEPLPAPPNNEASEYPQFPETIQETLLTTDNQVPRTECCITFLNPVLKDRDPLLHSDSENTSQSNTILAGSSSPKLPCLDEETQERTVQELEKTPAPRSSPSKRLATRPPKGSSEGKPRPKSIHKMTLGSDSNNSVHFEFTSSGVKVTTSDKESFL